jgi:uncharacterized iron-regulated membrane protein
MVLWVPRSLRWVQLRAVLWFRTGLAPKARDFNWHNVLGIWSALPLIAIVASATVIGYPWASDLVYKIAGEAPPPRQGGGPPAEAGANRTGGAGSGAGANARAGAVRESGAGATTDAAQVATTPSLATLMPPALALMPEWRAATLQLPKGDSPTASITLDRGTGGQPQLRATVQMNRSTGAIAKYQPFDSLSTGRQLRGILRFAHTGEVLGIVGQTIAGLVTLASVVLVVTGISLSVRRAARAWSRRQPRAGAPVATGTVST